MANRKDVWTVLGIGGLTLIIAVAGLYLGFIAGRPSPRGRAIPHVPDQGPIVYEMHSVFSPPARVRLEWREIPGAKSYRITIMSTEDDSLFASPELTVNSWTIPPELRSRMKPQSVYHWQVAVSRSDGSVDRSDAASFATQ